MAQGPFTASEPSPKGRPRGRPRGLPPVRNRRPANVDRTEIVDFDKCPVCDGELSKVTDEYDRVVEHTRVFKEIVKYDIKRRYCCRYPCKMSACP